MMREDCKNPFYKEKFINDLPNLFAHKIREVLSQCKGGIQYDELTYGDIISLINGERLKMCIDVKLGNQLTKDKKKAKYGLPLVAMSRRKMKVEKLNFKHRRYHKKKANFLLQINFMKEIKINTHQRSRNVK